MEKTKMYYIAYFDILGYKNYFDENDSDIQTLLKKNVAIANDTNEMTGANSSFSYKMFSDNCIIMISENSTSPVDELGALIHLVSALQLKFLKDYGILIRGGITKGEAYIDSKIVFGKGLIRAVEMEMKEAKYPRIIIDNVISDIIDLENYNLVKKDSDGLYYLDFFSVLEKVDDVFFPEKDKKRKICEVRDQVFLLCEKNCKYDKRISDSTKIERKDSIIQKYVWLLLKYNKFILDNNLPGKITYNISIYEKIYRFELVNFKKESWPIVAN